MDKTNIYESKIVIVDDCKDITECISSLLKFENFTNIDTFNTPQEALDVLYTSETFDRLQDDETGMYYQSAGYVYSFLSNEIKTAKFV